MKLIKGLKSSLILFLIVFGIILCIDVGPSFATNICTGGAETIDGDYTVHKFTSNGTLTCLSAVTAEVLVVAGGGAGRRGGGGGGGVIHQSSFSIPSGSKSVTVGAGGNGGNGGNSVFSSITALGGGIGGSSSADAAVGGSGGGGGVSRYIAGAAGYQGHYGGNGSVHYLGGGGGGGAGSAGSNSNNSNGGNGGTGITYTISGSSVCYAGGGGGGGSTGGTATCGGGNGSYSSAVSGTANTGGGGGGVYSAPVSQGGSGIVIVRYLTKYVITATDGSNGNIAPAGVTRVSYGANQTYNITPYDGYLVSDVLVDGLSVGAVTSYTFSNVTANHTIKPVFAYNATGSGSIMKYYYDNLNRLSFIENTANSTLVEYQYDEVGNRLQKAIYNSYFTTLATSGSGGSITGAKPVPAGQSQTFTITPSSSNYLIADVIVDGVSVGKVTSYTFNNVNANHNISASFVYTDTASIDNTYYATLQEAYNAASNGATIKVTAKNLTENLNVNKNISVTLQGGYDGYHSTITGNTIMQGMIQTYPSSGTLTIKNFILQGSTNSNYSITANAGNGGSVSPSGTVVVPYGYGQSFTIAPNLCYQINDVLVDGASTGAITNYAFDNVTANHTINASFAHIPDYNDSYTKLLLHMDGTVGSTTFTDSSTSAHNITAVGSVSITDNGKFGQFGFFPAISDYLTSPDHEDWYLASGDFTIDMWLYFMPFTWTQPGDYFGICGQYVDSNNFWYLILNGWFGKLTFNVVSGGSIKAGYYTTANALSAGWQHVALVRKNSNIYIFVNGISQTLTVGNAISTNEIPDLAAPLEVGAAYNHSYYFPGGIDEFRISKGIARHTTDFTPPVAPYCE